MAASRDGNWSGAALRLAGPLHAGHSFLASGNIYPGQSARHEASSPSRFLCPRTSSDFTHTAGLLDPRSPRLQPMVSEPSVLMTSMVRLGTAFTSRPDVMTGPALIDG